MVLPIKIAKTIPFVGVLPRRGFHQGGESGIMTILAIYRGSWQVGRADGRPGRLAGEPLRDGHGRAVLTPGPAARYPCFPAGRLKLTAGQLRRSASSRRPAEGHLRRRAS
jgi:hypothetical protein